MIQTIFSVVKLKYSNISAHSWNFSAGYFFSCSEVGVQVRGEASLAVPLWVLHLTLAHSHALLHNTSVFGVLKRKITKKNNFF